MVPVPDLEELARRLGLQGDSPRLEVAVTHSSYAAEHDTESNEQLEFLGDAVVDLAAADLIVRTYPHLDQGEATLVRARVVNESALARAATRLDLAAYVRVGRGEVKKRGVERPSLLADAFEAVVAALYLDRGFDAARAFVADQLADEVAAAAQTPREVDPKARLTQWTLETGRGRPIYDVVATGPSHARTFDAVVTVDGGELARGSGSSKKSAEADAAERALEARHA